MFGEMKCSYFNKRGFGPLPLAIFKHVLNFINRLLAKRAYHYSSVTQTDTAGFLVINQSELERNKFGLIA